jgi:hypothetical protein
LCKQTGVQSQAFLTIERSYSRDTLILRVPWILKRGFSSTGGFVLLDHVRGLDPAKVACAEVKGLTPFICQVIRLMN